VRLLVTGSQTWVDAERIRLAFVEARSEYPAIARADRTPTLVSGACPDGADPLCEEFARQVGWLIERHPALGACKYCGWSHSVAKFGKRAFYLRNQAMVNLGADLCLAFHRDNSPGTAMTIKLCRQAGIPVKPTVENSLANSDAGEALPDLLPGM
jgi:hypothetical protein